MSALQRMACLEVKLAHMGSCCFRVEGNSVLCVLCGKWTHSRCAGVKGVTQKL